MQRVLSILGGLVFQLFFAAALVSGVVGTMYCVREWRAAPEDDVNILPAGALLTASLAVVGLMGIVRFRNPRLRAFDIEADIAPLRPVKPLGNIVSGAVCLLVGVGGIAVQIELGRDVISIPVLLICAGAVQLGFGAWQLRRKQPDVRE